MADLRWPDPVDPADLERCPDCGWRYPDEILNPVVSNRSGSREPVCGPCALRRINKIHGARFRWFNGSMAEDFRQDALAFRREHPEYAPKKKTPPPPAG